MIRIICYELCKKVVVLILILRIFRFIKLRILVLRCPGNTIFGVLEALKFKIFRSSPPPPPPPQNPPGVSSPRFARL